MAKRKHKEIMEKILTVIDDGKDYSHCSLERKVNTNWKTIRDTCEELNFLGALEISKTKKVKITDHGKSVLKKNKE